MARVLVAMSGGVDSSVAAALAHDGGHEVVGVTMKLWGGASDTGCCSVADVDDARRVADRLGIDHYTWSFADDFEAHVVDPYVAAHRAGRTPNPCIECNRHLKFDRLLERARRLGFERVVTGHHARIVTRRDGTLRVARGRDRAKDQSYVLHMLDQSQLAHLAFPIGELTKGGVRELARSLGLGTAAKPDSQDVCFITTAAGRAGFLSDRLTMTPGRVVDADGSEVGTTDAVELVTVGQRRGLGLSGAGTPRYAIDVDVAAAMVTVGPAEDLRTAATRVRDVVWADARQPAAGPLAVQTSAHGDARPARFDGSMVCWEEPVRRVAPGQSVVFYEGDTVVGGGIAA